MLRSLSERVRLAAQHDDDGGSAVLEFTFLGLLLLVPVVYLVLTVGAVQGASFAVVGAADQAAKVFVDSETPDEAHSRAQQAVDLAVSDFNFPSEDATVTVDLMVPLPLIPTMPGLNTSAATVDSSATQLVERFG
jgi:hypothetical protein